jgi:hypothetical protein
MDQLPPDFAKALARVIEPGQDAAVAQVIEAATLLDDAALRTFLEKFATRIRASPKPVTSRELLQLLRDATAGGPANAI